MSELQLTIFTYGPNQRRVEIEIRPVIPEGIRGKLGLMEEWANSLILVISPDLKHTNAWDCELCGKPSRETSVQVASWIHLPQPKIVVYIHHLCEAGKNPCHTAIVEQGKLIGMMAGGRSSQQQYEPKPEGMEYPLAASCCGCKRDETARPGAKLSRCGRCKLSRYCGTECQSEDWQRHKKICKYVKSVQWAHWDS